LKVPIAISNLGLSFYKFRKRAAIIFRKYCRLFQIRTRHFFRLPIRIIIGASSTRESGWISTEQEFFNLTDQRTISKFLRNSNVDAYLLEHVLEHLSIDDSQIALSLLANTLKTDGYIRIAVPDGNHPNDDYLYYVGVDGPDDHKYLWRVSDFERISSELGLNLTVLEFCDEMRIRQKVQHLDNRGLITRRFLNLNSDHSNWQSSTGPSSLIVDLYQ
jgi:predicted SAM-dependent methyltransferase